MVKDHIYRTVSIVVGVLLLSASATMAQGYSRGVSESYRVYPNITYLKVGPWEAKVDIYSRGDNKSPRPTLVWLHGGTSLDGSKDNQTFNLLRYMEWGWNVVNVEHRLPGVTLAPAALQNSLCALRWITHNAHEYGFDTTKIVISGSSSGGWFAVTAGLGVRPDGWDDACPGSEDPKVAAVINWYGNWDLADVLEGPNRKAYALGWVRDMPNPMDVARQLSPLPFRSRSIAPVLSIHGDADPTVPYTQSVRLHRALKDAGVKEEMITIPNGKHGGFSREDNERAFAAIQAFLNKLDMPAVDRGR